MIHTANLFLDRTDNFTNEKITRGVTQLLEACVKDGGVKRVIVAGSWEKGKKFLSVYTTFYSTLY